MSVGAVVIFYIGAALATFVALRLGKRQDRKDREFLLQRCEEGLRYVEKAKQNALRIPCSTGLMRSGSRISRLDRSGEQDHED